MATRIRPRTHGSIRAPELPGRWFWIPLFGFLLAGLAMPVVLTVVQLLGFEPAAWMIWSTIVLSIIFVWALTNWLLPTNPKVRHTRRR